MSLILAFVLIIREGFWLFYFVLTYVHVSSLLLSSENLYGTRPIYGVLDETWIHSC